MEEIINRLLEKNELLRKVRLMICKIVGHNYICLHMNSWDNGASTTSGWKCQRCGDTNYEQWDE